MKKQAFTGILILFMGFYATTNAQVIKKTISINNRLSTTKTFQDSMRLKKFAPNTMGGIIQLRQEEFNKLTPNEQTALKNMDLKRLGLTDVSYRIPENSPLLRYIYPENYSTIKINSFEGLHPCGIAVSKTGKFAISTYEGDQKEGAILIWNSVADFKNGKTAYKQYSVPDPEAIVFDNNEALYVSSTYNGKIYFLKSILDNPFPRFLKYVNGPISYFIDASGNSNSAVNWNPRGLAVNANNELLVMCENLQKPNLKSVVLKVTNANTNNPNRIILGGSNQNNNNAIGVAVSGNILYTTDLNNGDGFVRKYSISGNSIAPLTNLPNAGAALDIITEGSNVYFTNVSNGRSNVVRWNPSNNETKNIDMGALKTNDPITASWGLAIYGNDLIIADAIHNNVKIVNKNSF